MLNEQLDSRFLFPSPLLPLGDFLMEFSEQSLFPVSIRSIENGDSINDMKVIMHNKASGEIRGLKEGAQVGMTIPEILETLPIDPKARETEIAEIEKNDQESVRSNRQHTHNQVTLDAKGFVRVFQRIVTPLAGHNGKMLALSTISLELTQYTNLLHLFELYKRYYQNHEGKDLQAIKKFSTYLHLDTYFAHTLTLGEITALLAMTADARHKQAAELITYFYKKPCAAKTISTYASLIRDKLKKDIDMHSVLYSLRDYYQRQPMLFEQL